METYMRYLEQARIKPDKLPSYEDIEKLSIALRMIYTRYFSKSNELSEEFIEKICDGCLMLVEALIGYYEGAEYPVDQKFVDFLSDVQRFFRVPTMQEPTVRLMGNLLLELILDPSLNYWLGYELVKFFYDTLKNYVQPKYYEYFTENMMYMIKLSDLMNTRGDYEFQCEILRIIFRLIPPNKIHDLAKAFIPENETLRESFASITLSSLDLDCRNFLNQVNGETKGVFSIKTDVVVMERTRIIPPKYYDGSLKETEIWVDFNINSSTVTIQCSARCLSEVNVDDDVNDLILIHRSIVKSVYINPVKRQNVLNIDLLKSAKVGLNTSRKLITSRNIKMLLTEGDAFDNLIRQCLPTIFGELFVPLEESFPFLQFHKLLQAEEEEKQNQTVPKKCNRPVFKPLNILVTNKSAKSHSSTMRSISMKSVNIETSPDATRIAKQKRPYEDDDSDKENIDPGASFKIFTGKSEMLKTKMYENRKVLSNIELKKDLDKIQRKIQSIPVEKRKSVELYKVNIPIKRFSKNRTLKGSSLGSISEDDEYKNVETDEDEGFRRNVLLGEHFEATETESSETSSRMNVRLLMGERFAKNKKNAKSSFTNEKQSKGLFSSIKTRSKAIKEKIMVKLSQESTRVEYDGKSSSENSNQANLLKSSKESEEEGSVEVKSVENDAKSSENGGISVDIDDRCSADDDNEGNCIKEILTTNNLKDTIDTLNVEVSSTNNNESILQQSPESPKKATKSTQQSNQMKLSQTSSRRSNRKTLENSERLKSPEIENSERLKSPDKPTKLQMTQHSEILDVSQDSLFNRTTLKLSNEVVSPTLKRFFDNFIISPIDVKEKMKVAQEVKTQRNKGLSDLEQLQELINSYEKLEDESVKMASSQCSKLQKEPIVILSPIDIQMAVKHAQEAATSVEESEKITADEEAKVVNDDMEVVGSPDDVTTAEETTEKEVSPKSTKVPKITSMTDENLPFLSYIYNDDTNDAASVCATSLMNQSVQMSEISSVFSKKYMENLQKQKTDNWEVCSMQSKKRRLYDAKKALAKVDELHELEEQRERSDLGGKKRKRGGTKKLFNPKSNSGKFYEYEVKRREEDASEETVSTGTALIVYDNSMENDNLTVGSASNVINATGATKLTAVENDGFKIPGNDNPIKLRVQEAVNVISIAKMTEADVNDRFADDRMIKNMEIERILNNEVENATSVAKTTVNKKNVKRAKRNDKNNKIETMCEEDVEKMKRLLDGDESDIDIAVNEASKINVDDKDIVNKSKAYKKPTVKTKAAIIEQDISIAVNESSEIDVDDVGKDFVDKSKANKKSTGKSKAAKIDSNIDVAVKESLEIDVEDVSKDIVNKTKANKKSTGKSKAAKIESDVDIAVNESSETDVDDVSKDVVDKSKANKKRTGKSKAAKIESDIDIAVKESSKIVFDDVSKDIVNKSKASKKPTVKSKAAKIESDVDIAVNESSETDVEDVSKDIVHKSKANKKRTGKSKAAKIESDIDIAVNESSEIDVDDVSKDIVDKSKASKKSTGKSKAAKIESDVDIAVIESSETDVDNVSKDVVDKSKANKKRTGKSKAAKIESDINMADNESSENDVDNVSKNIVNKSKANKKPTGKSKAPKIAKIDGSIMSKVIKKTRKKTPKPKQSAKEKSDIELSKINSSNKRSKTDDGELSKIDLSNKLPKTNDSELSKINSTNKRSKTDDSKLSKIDFSQYPSIVDKKIKTVVYEEKSDFDLLLGEDNSDADSDIVLSKIVSGNKRRRKNELSERKEGAKLLTKVDVHTTEPSSNVDVHTTEPSSNVDVHTTEPSSKLDVITAQVTSKVDVHITEASSEVDVQRTEWSGRADVHTTDPISKIGAYSTQSPLKVDIFTSERSTKDDVHTTQASSNVIDDTTELSSNVIVDTFEGVSTELSSKVDVNTIQFASQADVNLIEASSKVDVDTTMGQASKLQDIDFSQSPGATLRRGNKTVVRKKALKPLDVKVTAVKKKALKPLDDKVTAVKKPRLEQPVILSNVLIRPPTQVDASTERSDERGAYGDSVLLQMTRHRYKDYEDKSKEGDDLLDRLMGPDRKDSSRRRRESDMTRSEGLFFRILKETKGGRRSSVPLKAKSRLSKSRHGYEVGRSSTRELIGEIHTVVVKLEREVEHLKSLITNMK